MSGTLTLHIRGQDYPLSGDNVESLGTAVAGGLDGGFISFQLEPSTKPLKPLGKPSFRFITNRGAVRLSKADQRELFKLCEQVLAGQDRCWPPKFTTTFLGSTSN